eukprot:352098-Chlamydomonas_euryale.AAC.5
MQMSMPRACANDTTPHPQHCHPQTPPVPVALSRAQSVSAHGQLLAAIIHTCARHSQSRLTSHAHTTDLTDGAGLGCTKSLANMLLMAATVHTLRPTP